MTDKIERWRPVESWPYEVSDFGRVRRSGAARGTKIGRLLKAAPDAHGYPRVTLRRPGAIRFAGVHQLVAAAFLGPKPEDEEVLHRDEDKANPALNNLRYGTHQENMQTAAIPAGESHRMAQHSDKELLQALRLAKLVGLRPAAQDAGVRYGTLKQLARGANRPYLKEAV